MKMVAKGLALAVLACITAPQAFAQTRGGSVSYHCDGGRTLAVSYSFNSAGIPTQARMRINGANRVLSYDLDRSSDVETFFKDRSGYTLSSDYIDASNYQRSAALVMAPNGNILFKGCQARGHATANRPAPAPQQSRNGGSVNYRCQNNRRVTVQYRFNAQGVPTQAVANLQGANRTLRYDMNNSTDTETYFIGSGYRIGAGYMDIHNYTTNSGINIYSPRHEMLYKGCEPTR
ncbi:hypothetical protein CO612_05660 [Lysobacteraceae bacterium NML71-0210]|nr:hypothetical protein CO609_06595 [Xanthomonadaceae bacterium NML91-0268]PJK04756.1 hypothetical protein CO612_05660 [Xanthomonadaceae bacterium NML71-0210]